jgi:hypothetical protein
MPDVPIAGIPLSVWLHREARDGATRGRRFDRSNQGATVATGANAALESARLSVNEIIAAAEKLQAGASVLDVSFEPKEGKPAYAVRTYANGKVWDGLLGGTSGAAMDHGAVIDEKALEAEDKAEVNSIEKRQDHAVPNCCLSREGGRRPCAQRRTGAATRARRMGNSRSRRNKAPTNSHRPDHRQNSVTQVERHRDAYGCAVLPIDPCRPLRISSRHRWGWGPPIPARRGLMTPAGLRQS